MNELSEWCYSERHMGTNASLSFICEHKEKADALAKEVFSALHSYELRFSRFLPESEISMLNRSGSGVVSDVFIAILKRSIELTHLTDGAFNPLVQVSALGYDAPFAHIEKTIAHLNEKPYDTDIHAITIDSRSNTVTLGFGQQLDFGGVLKGYLAALLADEIMKKNPNCRGCVINIGGDLATRGYDEFHKPFIFLLYNPVTSEEMEVSVTDSSLATSGTYARKWKTEEGMFHHIVDSKSRRNPAMDLVAVSVIGDDGSLTEALTKLFLTRGIEAAVRMVSPKTYGYQHFAVFANGKMVSTIL
jgi:thiamine biosynthesis lipoprotein